jgi:hypothetical protein
MQADGRAQKGAGGEVALDEFFRDGLVFRVGSLHRERTRQWQIGCDCRQSAAQKSPWTNNEHGGATLDDALDVAKNFG